MLKSINLRDNNLGMEGWCAIFHALRDNKGNKIESWDLSRQGLGSEIAKALAEYAVWFKRERVEGRALEGSIADVTNSDDMEVYYWIDFACVDQTSPGADMAALPAYAAACHAIRMKNGP